jgi:biopolymer transport protein ExbD
VIGDLAQRKKPKGVLSLQLTSMVDLVTILILYLLVSTVFGVSDLVFPADLQLPNSLSKESIDAAPQVLVHKGHVTFSVTKKTIGVGELSSGSSTALAFLTDIKREYSNLKSKLGKKTILVSLIADKNEKYSTIFSVVAQVKRTGFDTVIFVASGGAQ